MAYRQYREKQLKSIYILAIVLMSSFLFGCGSSETEWVLLNAPFFMNEDEPGTGTPYLRAPLSDWTQRVVRAMMPTWPVGIRLDSTP